MIYNLRVNLSFTNEFLCGLWVATEEFCSASDINGMLLYLGPCEWNYKMSRKAYLIMHHDGIVIANKKFVINFYNFWDLFNPINNTSMKCDVELVDIDATDESMKNAMEDTSEIPIDDIMPTNLQFSLDYGKCCLSLYDDDKVYAELYKDAVNSC